MQMSTLVDRHRKRDTENQEKRLRYKLIMYEKLTPYFLYFDITNNKVLLFKLN